MSFLKPGFIKQHNTQLKFDQKTVSKKSGIRGIEFKAEFLN